MFAGLVLGLEHSTGNPAENDLFPLVLHSRLPTQLLFFVSLPAIFRPSRSRYGVQW
jgi:hypothetical protein